MAAWGLAAIINLSAGAFIASWPERGSDLNIVREWGYSWLIDGTHIYKGDEFAPDYPPHAIVALSPIGLLPSPVAPLVWATLNIGLALLSVHLTVRSIRPGKTGGDVVVLMLMCLCWGAFRTLLQFSLLTYTFGIAAFRLADRRPGWSGVCLGLALMKPQIAAPFVLWAFLTRRIRHLAVATAVVAGGFALYAVRARVEPARVVADYLDILRIFYTGGTSGLVGIAQIRPLFARLIADAARVDLMSGAVSLLLLAGVCVLGLAERRPPGPPQPHYFAPALAGIWSLLTFFHLTYGFVLLLPAATLLLLLDHPESRAPRTKIFWVMQALLMFDPPTLWRWFGRWSGLPERLGAVLLDADRLWMVMLFVAMTVLGWSRVAAERDGRDNREQHGIGGHP